MTSTTTRESMPNLLQKRPGLLHAVADIFLAAFRRRPLLRDLSELKDHILKDIGLSRSDVERAILAPLGSDPMADLARARTVRSV